MGKVVIIIEMEHITHKEYDAIIRELNETGQAFNEKRPSHVSFDKDGKWCVIDVWDSAQELNVFVSTVLAPVFLKLGIKPPSYTVYPVHNYMGKKVDEIISA